MTADREAGHTPDLAELRQTVELALELAVSLPRPDVTTVAALAELVEHLDFLEALHRAETQ